MRASNHYNGRGWRKAALAWFRSLNGHVIFSAPAIPDNRTSDEERAVTFEVMDPGAYKLTLVGYRMRKHSEGARGTEAEILKNSKQISITKYLILSSTERSILKSNTLDSKF